MPRLPRSRRRSGLEPDGRILRLAADQHGVVTRVQLLAAGIGPDRVDRRLAAGVLRQVHRGVYVVGPVIAPWCREMAATLACGAPAVVSHRSAAAVWKLLPPEPADAPVDVALPHGNRRRTGIRVHRMRSLQPDEVDRQEGIPITTPTRTLLDLAAVLGARDLERAAAEALAARLTSTRRLRTLLDRHAGRPGVGSLRALVDDRPARTRSCAEEVFLALVRRAQLPQPDANAAANGYQVDFFWRTERVVVEVDGFAYHASRRSFEADRRRDAVLAAAGVRVIRVTWRQLEGEAEAVIARLAQVLATRR
jgi:very-short-patch-repair endonuclease